MVVVVVLVGIVVAVVDAVGITVVVVVVVVVTVSVAVAVVVAVVVVVGVGVGIAVGIAVGVAVEKEHTMIYKFQFKHAYFFGNWPSTTQSRDRYKLRQRSKIRGRVKLPILSKEVGSFLKSKTKRVNALKIFTSISGAKRQEWFHPEIRGEQMNG